jgi:hypothetical protein
MYTKLIIQHLQVSVYLQSVQSQTQTYLPSFGEWDIGYHADHPSSYTLDSFQSKWGLHWDHHFHQEQTPENWHVPPMVHCIYEQHGSSQDRAHRMSVSAVSCVRLLLLDLCLLPTKKSHFKAKRHAVTRWTHEKFQNYIYKPLQHEHLKLLCMNTSRILTEGSPSFNVQFQWS